MELIPIYRSFSRAMITLKKWIINEPVTDSLVIIVDLRTGKITYGPGSGQRIIKYGEFESIPEAERDQTLQELVEKLHPTTLMEIEDLLNNPNKEAISSLLR